MSALIPFALFLKVGGNNESIAKLIVIAGIVPDDDCISTTKRLFVFEGVLVGRSGNCT